MDAQILGTTKWKHMSPEARFSACVPTAGPLPTPCLIWPFGKILKGYGVVRVNGRRMYAHRLAWEKANDVVPNGMCVCHRCDVPACVNPDHMFLGTTADNNADMVAKGRQAKGPKNGKWKHGRRSLYLS